MESLDGIVVARCWLEGESQQLSSSKWPVRHGLFQVGRVPAAPKFIRQAGRDVAEAFCATNAPLGPAVTHGLGFPLNLILAFFPPLNLFKFRRGVNLSPSFPAHHVRPLLQSMHCHGQLCCSLSAPVSRRLKLLESHGRYITARQCARGAQVPTSAYCGGPFITRPVYQMSREGLFIVQCRTHTAAPVPPLSLCPAIVGSSTEGHRWESQKPPCPPSQNGIYLSIASVVRYHDGRG